MSDWLYVSLFAVGAVAYLAGLCVAASYPFPD